ncbi:transcriptional regulator [Candidatus Symbiopectobacterium sp. 'North America']|uniref:winged helix-turn-helix transcriptional regulator n=1 Tax=Candidatus Symbiopectobacterium sp. 'North America' TaxID=2794574 RepID=UPI001E1A69DE|nr:helix-turn-helix domain-containing protein [Candidatus Symbiopectobacterium sp. 'North America']MBG6245003.1 transcriptional regulator [Candidatus Symbiopectobacterium sp. 'North America']
MNMTHSLVVLKDDRNISQVLSRVGDKWTMMMIYILQNGPLHFNGMKRSIDAISQQMLTRTLKALERDGIVKRTVLPTNPPMVQYALTALGLSLSQPVLALCKWACENLEKINYSQNQYDEKIQTS